MTWDTQLAEPIALTRGPERFRTLRDAATFLTQRYGKARGGFLEGAIRDLMTAAENPSEDAVGRATHQLAHYLADENPIKEMPALKDYGEGLEQRIREMLTGRGAKARSRVSTGIGRRRRKVGEER